MQIFTQPEDLRRQCRNWARDGETIALVPTMGYYHAGHEALMEHARKMADRVVISLFVNPTQFGPNEDLAAYPRDFERDSAIAAKHKADVLFAPMPESIYNADHATWVEVPDLAKGLCGKSRPSHFRGVCTIVLKLLMLAQPNFAIFGQKDWQQQAIIRKMAADLNLDTEIVALPAVREQDGLALSSRNVYLSESERKIAPQIRAGLLLARQLVQNGENKSASLLAKIKEFWAANLPEAQIDYLEIVEPETLVPLETISGPALMACAIYLGKARLIDNILL